MSSAAADGLLPPKANPPGSEPASDGQSISSPASTLPPRLPNGERADRGWSDSSAIAATGDLQSPSASMLGWNTVKVGSAARWHTPIPAGPASPTPSAASSNGGAGGPAAAAATAGASTTGAGTGNGAPAMTADGTGATTASSGSVCGGMTASASNTSLASKGSVDSDGGVLALGRTANAHVYAAEYGVRTPVMALASRKAHRSRSLNLGDGVEALLDVHAAWDVSALSVGGAAGDRGRQDLAHFAMRRDGKLLLAMVGLPARGKSFIAKGIQRHMDWLGIRTAIFNAGNYRRQVAGPNAPASLFDPDNPEGKRMRQRCAEMALEDAFRALEDDNVCVAIFDATNTTKARRSWVRDEVARRQPALFCHAERNDDGDDGDEEEASGDGERARGTRDVGGGGRGGGSYGGGTQGGAAAAAAAATAAAAGQATGASLGFGGSFGARKGSSLRSAEMGVVRLVFLESFCDNDEMIWNNVKEAKMHSPDYLGWKEEDAMTDFFQRINNYKKVYEKIEEAEGNSFIRLENTGEKLITFRARGYAIGRITQLLSNTQLALRPIILTRPGESLSTSQGRLGMDTSMTPQGGLYAKKFCETVHELALTRGFRPVVWASDMLSARQMVQPLVDRGYEVVHLPALNDLNAGAMSGLTYEQFAAKYPEEYELRAANKLKYRFPKGESYNDVFRRVEPIILELIGETSPVIIVSHTPVLRIIYGYLQSTPPDDCPMLDIPLHAAIILRPCGYGYEEERAYPLE